MTRARDIANNWAADITAVSAGVGITGGGTSGAVTVTNEMATTIDAKGDLVVGSGADAFVRVPVGSNNQVLTADSATTSGVKWATADALPSQTGNSGKYLTTNGTTASWGTVNTPIKWTKRRERSATGHFYSIATNGSSTFVAVGGNGRISSSTDDGITWTDRTSGTTQTFYKVVYGNGIFVAVASAGVIHTSTDGTTWTARTANMGTNIIYDVYYGNSTFVAVGSGGGTTNTGGITYSTDGITWTRKSQSISISATYYTVIWNGTNWIVGADDNGTVSYLYATTPGGTWTTARAGTGLGGVYQLFYDGTRTVFTDPSGSVYFTTSTTLASITQFSGGTIRTAGGGPALNVYYNGKIYFGGQKINALSTTPVNTSYADYTYYGESPAQSMDSAGVAQTNYSTIYVDATKYIVANNAGEIFTSF